MTNHRLATVAESTLAIRPPAAPEVRPKNSRICHNCSARADAHIESAEPTRLTVVMVRTPNRRMRTAATGPARPNSSNPIDPAIDSSDVDQTVDRSMSTSSAPGAARTPDTARIATMVTATMTHP